MARCGVWAPPGGGRGVAGGGGGGRGGGRGVILPYMVFASLSLGQGLQISVSVWNRVYFLEFRLWNTFGVTILLPESRYKRTLLLFPLGYRCMFTQTRRFRLEGQTRLTIFSLEQGTYFHDFVWNRVAKSRLFSLEQGQVLRHSATHIHPKLRGVPPPCSDSLQAHYFLFRGLDDPEMSSFGRNNSFVFGFLWHACWLSTWTTKGITFLRWGLIAQKRQTVIHSCSVRNGKGTKIRKFPSDVRVMPGYYDF